jgi:flagellar hook-associated protein 1 FlgK
MSGISFVLNLARGALSAQQQGIAVTAHNIANVNTPGYTRRRANFENLTSEINSRIKLGYGVVVDSVSQYYDRFITQNLQQKESVLGETEAKKSTLSYIQNLFNDQAGNGLSQVLSEFWNGWQDLANNPSGIPERTALLQKAEALTERFHTIRSDLTRVQNEVGNSLGASLNDLNKWTGMVAELNQKIVSSESIGTAANDLRDQRNEILKKISGLIEGNSFENGDGSVTFVTTNGLLLVDRAQSWKLSQNGSDIFWNEVPSDVSNRLQGGKIGGLLDLRDETLPQYAANLDELAGTLIKEVNDLHFAGFNLNGAGQIYFFENFQTPPNVPNTGDYTGAAAFIGLSTGANGVKNNPENIAAAQANLPNPPPALPSPLPGDNRNALKILSIQTDATLSIKKWTYADRGVTNPPASMTLSLDDYYRTLVGDIGVLTEGTLQQYDFTKTLVDNLNDVRDSISGVSLDEELTKLMELQMAYKAAAKLVTIADELYTTILQMR